MVKNARYFPSADNSGKMTNAYIGDSDERYGKQKRGSADDGGAQLTKNRYISTERSAPDTRANCVTPVEKYAIGKRYFTRSGFRVCEYVCRLQYIGQITIFMRLVTSFFVLALRNLAHRTVPKFDPRCQLNP
ncbi:Uncharacterized protein DBV15_10114 [Temnothorax longispinosus]|uniref:Uncharacterized protein n=1 Tax=Temnothorax longispinosus TaxID=300112 RepID=A0A4S2JBI2_9HYME|nr:Uncharacterized protein DBV15_10114 [Temnothorax longispinosus]